MVTGDPEKEMMRTYLTDTPPVEEGESQSRVIIEELGWFRMEDTLGLSGGEGGSAHGCINYLFYNVMLQTKTHQPQ